MNSILGYKRSSGPPGIRNWLLCVHTVECSLLVSQRIAAIDPRVQSLGFAGCYRSAYAMRLMVSLATHPNIGGVLLVSLGCEGTDAPEMAEVIRASGRPAEVLRIQETGGTTASIAHGQEIVAGMLKALGATPRVPLAPQDLVVGTECGGSDATSGIAANPAVGGALDRLVDAGGTAIVEETLEMLGCGEIAARRALTPKVARDLLKAVAKAEAFSRQAGHFSVAPGNEAGGLTTIEEKSMGAFAKSGSRPISGVIKVTERPGRSGLFVLDAVPDPSSFSFGYSNPNDSEGILALIACGAHLVVFTTGRGSVIGSVISPVLKVCGNPRTYAHMSGDMDVNAGRIVTGEAEVSQVSQEIYEHILAVAAGEPTAAERLGNLKYCVPYTHQELCPSSS